MNPSEEQDLILVKESEVGLRLDKLLANRFLEKYSRTYFQSLIEQHLVLVNGAPVKKREKLAEGDEIEIEFAITSEIDLKPEDIPLTILYEDEHLLAINKPAGMVVHPAVGNWTGTFVNALLFHCKHLSSLAEDSRPGIVHRLDKDTSGVLLAAKTIVTQQKLVELFASRKVYKEYLAICVGCPKEGEVNVPIGRHPVNRKQMAVIPSGRVAISYFSKLEWNGKLSLVKAVISTGRTHQIRVHLKHCGTPVLGDSLYGNETINQQYKVNRQLLHASLVRFHHPITNQEIEIQAPLPDDMQIFCTKWFGKEIKFSRI